MTRNVVRSFSLVLILLLALGTASAPVSAGAIDPSGFLFLVGRDTGTCAYLLSQTTGHYFVGTVIGAPVAPANPNNHQNSFENILVNGPYSHLPDGLGGCINAGTL